MQSNPQKFGFLKRSFPWFDKLNSLCGGSQADGGGETLFGERTDAGNSREGEEGSDSSDTPDGGGAVGGHIHVDVDVNPYPNEPDYDFHQEFENDVQLNRDFGQQGSDNSMPTSRSSGSGKRKSSDRGEPSVSRGEKIKETCNVRTRFFKSVVDNDEKTFALNEKLMTIFQGQLSVAERKLEKMNKVERDTERCMERLNEMGDIRGALRIHIMESFTERTARNVWIHGRDDDIYQWIENSFPNHFHQLRRQQQGSGPSTNQQPNPGFQGSGPSTNQQPNPSFHYNDGYFTNFHNQYRPPPSN